MKTHRRRARTIVDGVLEVKLPKLVPEPERKKRKIKPQ